MVTLPVKTVSHITYTVRDKTLLNPYFMQLCCFYDAFVVNAVYPLILFPSNIE